MWTDRTTILIGEENLKTLNNSHITIVGLGGVGGYVAFMLARAGVGHFTLIDFDKVDETNINRQVVANTKTVGMFKTDVIASMIKDINPNCKLEIRTEKLTNNNVSALISDCDYVVDCIDSVSDKVELCCFAYQNNIRIISAMGAGNRIDIPKFRVCDIYKTENDGLAKVMRKKLRERDVKKLTVVAPESLPFKKSENNVVGSISYYPAMCGCVLAAKVINDLIK